MSHYVITIAEYALRVSDYVVTILQHHYIMYIRTLRSQSKLRRPGRLCTDDNVVRHRALKKYLLPGATMPVHCRCLLQYVDPDDIYYVSLLFHASFILFIFLFPYFLFVVWFIFFSTILAEHTCGKCQTSTFQN